MSRIVRDQKNAELMAAGVTIEDPATAYIDADVDDRRRHDPASRRVASKGSTTIGAGCEIHSGARIVDSQIGDRVDDPQSLRHHRFHDRATTPRSARSRTCGQRAMCGARRKVGNFVEMKKTVLGAGSKAKHLAYLGDATIGEKVNIGAGTITCNYDGVSKSQTVIEDGAFIGSDTQLIAPVTIGKGAYVGSGTTIRERRPGGRAGGQRRQAAEHRRLGRAEKRRVAEKVKG